jgi:hypothetical protein
MTLPEADWRVLRAVHRTALDRYCARVLEECATGIQDTSSSAHDRYLGLFRLLNERDASMAAAFNDLRRSTAIQRLASMIALGVVTDEELSQFSQATRDSAMVVADLQRPGAKRRHLSDPARG